MRGMRTFDTIHKARLAGPTVLTIGNYDGIHRGHQSLLLTMRQIAQQLSHANGQPVNTAIITFDPHPVHVLRPDVPHYLLTTPMERLELAAAFGVTHGIIQPFTLETAQVSPRTFMEMLAKHLGLAVLVVGPDFALGRNRSGDLPTLRLLGEEFGYRVEVIDPVALGEEVVRSSHIRTLLSVGDVSGVAAALGRPYRVSGVVEHGDQRGRQVGLPTANLRVSPEKLLPADGVYVTRTWIASFDRIATFYSATNVGVRPTVDGLHRRVEAHILDFPPPGAVDYLYGRLLAVDFLARLRGEMRFSSVGELVNQIHTDIAQARGLIAEMDPTFAIDSGLRPAGSAAR